MFGRGAIVSIVPKKELARNRYLETSIKEAAGATKRIDRTTQLFIDNGTSSFLNMHAACNTTPKECCSTGSQGQKRSVSSIKKWMTTT